MAYRCGEQLGLAVWTEDEAGPFQTVPEPGASWEPVGRPARLPHEYVRNGTAKMLTLFHPATGEVRVKGVTSTSNVVLHAWIKDQISAIVAALPEPKVRLRGRALRAAWERWQEGLSMPITLPAKLPQLRMLLVMDNLTGHRTPELLVWLASQGVMWLYTPLSGCWLNMAESIQRILKRRALSGHTPRTPEQIMEWLEAAARGWNRAPTPFIWGGKRAARRARQRERRHAVGGSRAYTKIPIRRRRPALINGNEQVK